MEMGSTSWSRAPFQRPRAARVSRGSPEPRSSPKRRGSGAPWPRGHQHAVMDAYRRTLTVATGTPHRVLARVTQRQADRPLLAGRDAGDAPLLRRVLGCWEPARVWSAYSEMAPGDGSAVFSTIERGTRVLLLVEYTLRSAEAAPTRPLWWTV